jgi:ribosomal protein S13
MMPEAIYDPRITLHLESHDQQRKSIKMVATKMRKGGDGWRCERNPLAEPVQGQKVKENTRRGK